MTDFKVLSFTSNLHLTQQNVIFQQYYHSHCNYLLKMGCMNNEQAIFEWLTLSSLKKWSSTTLKTFNNYTTIMTNNNPTK